MRVTAVGFYLALRLGSLATAALCATRGCGQLWRPFLDPEVAPESDLAVADLAVPVDLGIPLWRIEPSGTAQTLYGVWGINITPVSIISGAGRSTPNGYNRAPIDLTSIHTNETQV